MPFAMSLPIPLLRTEDNMVRNSAFLAALLQQFSHLVTGDCLEIFPFLFQFFCNSRKPRHIIQNHHFVFF